jgi:hypothetical protein
MIALPIQAHFCCTGRGAASLFARGIVRAVRISALRYMKIWWEAV